MIEVYHNPRCTKSRQALQLLDEKGLEYDVIEYLKEHPSADDIRNLVNMLGIHPSELIRKKEEEWKPYKDKELEYDEYILAMAETPKLIERPIIIKGNKAVIGRPTEKILDLVG